MSVRTFSSIAQFASFYSQRVQAVDAEASGWLMLGKAVGGILLKNTKDKYGDHRLPALAQATQDDRAAKRYTTDDPLLREGDLRDSVRLERGPDFVAVGSNDPVAAYHEFGYVNHRTGKPVPPRAAFREGLRDSIPEAAQVTEEILQVKLGVSPVSARILELTDI